MGNLARFWSILFAVWSFPFIHPFIKFSWVCFLSNIPTSRCVNERWIHSPQHRDCLRTPAARSLHASLCAASSTDVRRSTRERWGPYVPPRRSRHGRWAVSTLRTEIVIWRCTRWPQRTVTATPTARAPSNAPCACLLYRMTTSHLYLHVITGNFTKCDNICNSPSDCFVADTDNTESQFLGCNL